MTEGAWSVIANPAAGRSRRRSRERLAALERRATELRAIGIDVVVERSTSLHDARERAHRAAAEGRDLVAAGGDGTAGALAGIAAEHGRRFAVVPIGSGNDFARVLDIDRADPVAALDLLDDAHGADRRIDLGVANGRSFSCVTCSGFDAEANRWANETSWLSGTPLYLAAVVRTLAVYRPRRFAITIDGERHERTAWMVSVGNTTTYGGGMRIVPDARLDDGLLDVCIIGAVSIVRFLANFPKVFAGRHTTVAGVEILRGAEIEVAMLDGRAGELWADGERVDDLPATMRARPGALVVRVPR